jgi:hypothetical protein
MTRAVSAECRGGLTPVRSLRARFGEPRAVQPAGPRDRTDGLPWRDSNPISGLVMIRVGGLIPVFYWVF